MKPHRGTLILVLGILGIVTCFPLGIAAWVMGRKDLREMDAGAMDPAGRGQTNAGRICGMIATLIGGIAFALAIIVMVLSALFYTWRQDAPSREIPRETATIPAVEQPAAVPTTPVR